MNSAESAATDATQPTEKTPWKPINSIQRRILGVLVEKAKTTPDQYPLSLNSLTTGCNQKNNREPIMNIDQDRVEESLHGLRSLGAVGEVQGSGRVAKYRHYMKDWLGVDGAELAVMTELLLRGEQMVGDLRGRANRMTKNEIPDVNSLKPVIDSLIQKKLVIALTPPGRGQVVAHALFEEREFEKLRTKYASGTYIPPPEEEEDSPAPRAAASSSSSAVSHSPAPPETQLIAGLRSEMAELREELTRLRKEVEDLWASVK